MKRRMIILLVPVFLLLAVGLVVGLARMGGSDQGARQAPSEFPEFVYYSASTMRGYRLAVDHQQLFADLPCYCGCGLLPDDPHRNLLDCFMNDDGSFDPHASGCTICVDIADDGVAWQAQGKSPDEVRSLVDEKYQSYGLPTSP